MRDDFLEVILRAKSLVLVLVQQLEYDVHKLITVLDLVLALVGEDHLGLADLKQQQLALAVVEWRHADEHLVDENAQSPPIDREIVALVHHHLWSEVLWSTAEGLGQLAFCESLGQTVIDDLKIARLVNEHVFKLKIAMHNLFGV